MVVEHKVRGREEHGFPLGIRTSKEPFGERKRKYREVSMKAGLLINFHSYQIRFNRERYRFPLKKKIPVRLLSTRIFPVRNSRYVSLSSQFQSLTSDDLENVVSPLGTFNQQPYS